MHFREDTQPAAVLRCLRQLVHALRVASHSVENELGLSGAQLFVLSELATHPGISIRRLSERTLTDPSSASVVVSHLVERDLVRRARDPDDARRTTLSITKKGQTVLAKAPEPYQVKLFAALRSLPQRQLHQLHRGLAALVAGMTQAGTAAPFFMEEVSPARKRHHAKRRPPKRS